MSTSDHDILSDRLSEFLDGTLAVSDHQAVADHLAVCGLCRRTLEELRAIVTEAKGLGPVSPPRDLWPGIAAAIQAPLRRADGDAKVLPLHVVDVPQHREAPPPTFSLSRPQLAAAATILIAVSVAITSWVGPGLVVREGLAVPEGSPGLIVAASTAPELPAELSAELEQLEATLRGSAATLDPETLRIVETNLGLIERAIGDSRKALTQDPANSFLTEHLDRAYHRKLDFLREVAQIAGWAS